MAITLYLELYREKMPDQFAHLPGSENFDINQSNMYWAVVTPPLSSNTPEADYIQPVPPSGPVDATTHGTDTLPAGATAFFPLKVCIWRPKEPPYRFQVITPNGQTFELNPPEGGDAHIWHCTGSDIANSTGIWTVTVDRLDAQELPISIDGRNAHLNPQMLDFTAEFFEQQPLLRVDGQIEQPNKECAELESLQVVSGCAPGQVSFQAAVDLPDSVVELSWDFGDGSAGLTFSGQDVQSGMSVNHTYTLSGSFIATVTILRQPNCSPQVKVMPVNVPLCPDGSCSELQGAVVLSGCAPGTVQFQAQVQNPSAALEISWDFGDGSLLYFTPAQIAQGQGLSVEHTYSSGGDYSAVVTVVRQPGCSPMGISEPVTVSACPQTTPDCARLLSVELVRGCAPGEVSLRLEVSQPDEIEEITWDFGDGSQAVFTGGQMGLGQGLEVTHTYTTQADFSVVATILRHAGCSPRSQSEAVTVRACREDPRCPQLTGIGIDGCMPENGPPANLTLTAQGQNLELAQEFRWEFGDGSNATTAGPQTTHAYNSPGPFEIRVEMTRPERCQPRRQSARLERVTIPACPAPPDGGGLSESCLCTLLRILGLAFLIIGLVLIFGGACSVNIPVAVGGGVMAAIGAVLLIIWALTCGRALGCRIFQALIALLMVATVIMGFIALIFGILAIFEIGAPCFVGAIIDLGILGVLTTVLTWIFYGIGCRWRVGGTFPV